MGTNVYSRIGQSGPVIGKWSSGTRNPNLEPETTNTHKVCSQYIDKDLEDNACRAENQKSEKKELGVGKSGHRS